MADEKEKTEAVEKRKPTGLELMREPFPENQISLLPKPMKKREEMDKLPKAKCKECGGYHATSMMLHLSYVGHAALTDRLLDADPLWRWEPLSFDANTGLPLLDKDGGMWIKLTVCGVTRLGYGDAQGKSGGDATKERIGDALRNAAMRFGAALDLWHKGDLHLAEEDDPPKGDDTGGKNSKKAEEEKPDPKRKAVDQWLTWIDNHVKIEGPTAAGILEKGWKEKLEPGLKTFPADQQNELKIAYKDTLRLLREREVKA